MTVQTCPSAISTWKEKSALPTEPQAPLSFPTGRELHAQHCIPAKMGCILRARKVALIRLEVGSDEKTLYKNQKPEKGVSCITENRKVLQMGQILSPMFHILHLLLLAQKEDGQQS